VTFTFHSQLGGACTSSCWLPTVFTAVTELPEATALVTAGLVPGLVPVAYTKTWNAGPDTGAGVHWYAQPMFHGPLDTVNDVLVHVPLVTGVGPSSTWTMPDGAGDAAGRVVDVEPPVAAIVVGDDGTVVEGDVLLVEPPDVEPLGAGSV
jgi:hypothetical protein